MDSRTVAALVLILTLGSAPRVASAHFIWFTADSVVVVSPGAEHTAGIVLSEPSATASYGHMEQFAAGESRACNLQVVDGGTSNSSAVSVSLSVRNVSSSTNELRSARFAATSRPLSLAVKCAYGVFRSGGGHTAGTAPALWLLTYYASSSISASYQQHSHLIRQQRTLGNELYLDVYHHHAVLATVSSIAGAS